MSVVPQAYVPMSVQLAKMISYNGDLEIGYDYQKPVYGQTFVLPPIFDDVDAGPYSGHNDFIGTFVGDVEDRGIGNHHRYFGADDVDLFGPYAQFSSVFAGDVYSSSWGAYVNIDAVLGDLTIHGNGDYYIGHLSGDAMLNGQVTLHVFGNSDIEAYAGGVLGQPGVTVIAGSGNDEIYGGDGDDSLYGGNGSDEIDGGNGSDKIDGGNNADYLSGGSGDDTILGGDGNDDIWAGDGNDTVNGDDDNDSIHGGNGDDLLVGAEGHDHIGGDDGDDIISGGNGDDYIHGDAGNDTMNGGTGRNILDGGNGDDVFIFGGGQDHVWGGGGEDLFLADLNQNGSGQTVFEDFNRHEDQALASIGYETVDMASAALASDNSTFTWGDYSFTL